MGDIFSKLSTTNKENLELFVTFIFLRLLLTEEHNVVQQKRKRIETTYELSMPLLFKIFVV